VTRAALHHANGGHRIFPAAAHRGDIAALQSGRACTPNSRTVAAGVDARQLPRDLSGGARQGLQQATYLPDNIKKFTSR
jgi:hypothetical protein